MPLSGNKFPAYKTLRLDELIPYARNSRTHSDEQVAQVAASIKEFGFTNPVLVDSDGGIIAGHGRVLAARKLGLTEVPCIELSHLTDAQKQAYVIADNQLALNAGWDLEMLKVEIGELSDGGFDIDLLGFGDDFLAGLMTETTAGKTDEDFVPEPPEEPVTKPGDVWVLGNHRLMCGDSTDATSVGRVMGGKGSADIIFTSPPYAQQRDYGAAKEKCADWDGLMAGAFLSASVKDGGHVLVNLGIVHDKGRVNVYWENWIAAMGDGGWPLFGWYVWDKGFGAPGDWNGRLAPSHEFIFHFAKKPSRANKWVDKKPENIAVGHGKNLRGKDGTTKEKSNPNASLQPTKVADSVIRVSPHMARTSATGTHPAVFPVALCEHIYQSYAKAGDVVYEPFCGSGTSIIACEKFGASCCAMELDPVYVDIAVKRWEEFTGKKAVLEGSGEQEAA